MPATRLLFAAVVAACGGCSAIPSSIFVSITVVDGTPAPGRLSLAVYDATHALLRDRVLTPPQLPNSVIVTVPTPAVDDPAVRLALTGLDEPVARGWNRVNVRPGAQVRVEIALDRTTMDRDGDGVPDAIDDCPMVADPDQVAAAGQIIGDACRAVDGGR
jgi:hypothetical protein